MTRYRPELDAGPRLVGLLLALLLAPASAALCGEPVDIEPESFRPGLMAAYHPASQAGPALHRIDARPAFSVGTSSPHPRLPAGPFEAEWSGLILWQEAGPIRFDAVVGGTLRIVIDGETVLDGAGPSDGARLAPGRPIERRPGAYPIQLSYRSHAGIPARLQVFWSGDAFAREPLPPWRLGHLDASITPDLARGLKAEAGRSAVGRLGCARCHRDTFPAVTDPPPGPSLADASRRLGRDWLFAWLDDPAALRPGARMPALFPPGRAGQVERWLLVDALVGPVDRPAVEATPGDHRAGRLAYLSIGCVACHFVPEQPRAGQPDLDRTGFDGLANRLSLDDLAAFLANPHGRYPDGRMPRLPLTPDTARDIAAYLLLWSEPTRAPAMAGPPTPDEMRDLARRLGVSDRRPQALASALMNAKGCVACHVGLGPVEPRTVAIGPNARGGCLADGPGDKAPRFALDPTTREAIAAYLDAAPSETHPSPFAERQSRLARAGCVRCHQRNGDRPPPLEIVGRTLGGAYLQTVPYQRTPRLTDPHQRLLPSYLVRAVREGVSGVRSVGSTYRMPAYDASAAELVTALAEADGARSDEPDPPARVVADPTLGTLAGPSLVGSGGYACISCHVWNGQQLAQPDPSAVGPDLTTVVGRLRPDWFDRFVEDPGRSYPGTPMPAIFPRSRPHATITAVLDGDPARQRDAIWSYLARGRSAPPPKPPAPVPVAGPLAAQVPIHLPNGAVVESVSLLGTQDDLLIYDLATFSPRTLFAGASVLRSVQGRTRQFLADGTPSPLADGPIAWAADSGRPIALTRTLQGYDRPADGLRIRTSAIVDGTSVGLTETLRFEGQGSDRRLSHEVVATGLPAGRSLVVRRHVGTAGPPTAESPRGQVRRRDEGEVAVYMATPDRDGTLDLRIHQPLPPARSAKLWQGTPVANPDPEPGTPERPGYRAVAFPRIKTVAGEDRVMPGAMAVDPRDGRLFVASLKTGELFVANRPRGEASTLSFENYAGGLFQDCFAMRAEPDGLKVLHRRNLTNVVDTDGDGRADRFDRVLALPHGVADSYDFAYGLPRDKTGAYILSYAPHANQGQVGSGSVLRWEPGKAPEEVAFGLRNPLGWAAGPEGEIFFTDNQGEWVASNKLAHVEPGRYYGYPNPAQRQHAKKPLLRAAVWVPYAWARSINGMAYDATGGKFGPFAGQFFLAELMYGGAIVRANVERVNGHYQGACFPFWGKGLLGPVSLAFDPAGPLYVGGITEPGWMAQPDRGAVFRIDHTGEIPFEMQSIHARPRGFRVVFTRPVDRASAQAVAAHAIERYRYEYTGAYGSPELDRTRVAVERAEVAADGRSVELTTEPLAADYVYMITTPGVRSDRGEPPLFPGGAYTLNEIPAGD